MLAVLASVATSEEPNGATVEICDPESSNYDPDADCGADGGATGNDGGG